MDQRISSYSTNTKSLGWNLTAFSYVLDSTRVNAQTIFSMNNGIDSRKINAFGFGWRLVHALTTPQIRRRQAETGLQWITKQKIQLMLCNNDETENNCPSSINQRRGMEEQRYSRVTQELQIDPTEASTSTAAAAVPSPVQPLRKRCYTCIDSIRGPGYCAKRKKLPPQPNVCCRCSKNICKSHSLRICSTCS